MKRINAFTIVAYFFAIFGVAGLIGCLLMGIDTKELIEQGIETTGTVVEFRESTDKGHTSYAPVVEFTTIDERTIKYYSS